MPVIYHTDGGGVCEMASRYGVGIGQVEEFEAALATVLSSYDVFREKAIETDLSAETMCRKYLEVMTS